MQPKIIGSFARDDPRGGCDKAAKQVYLNGGTSFIRYGMDKKTVLFNSKMYHSVKPFAEVQRRLALRHLN